MYCFKIVKAELINEKEFDCIKEDLEELYNYNLTY